MTAHYQTLAEVVPASENVPWEQSQDTPWTLMNVQPLGAAIALTPAALGKGYKIKETPATGAHGIYTYRAFAAVNHTVLALVQANERPVVVLDYFDGGADVAHIYDLGTGTLGPAPSPALTKPTITPLGNNWHLISGVFKGNGQANQALGIYVRQTLTTGIFPGETGKGVTLGRIAIWNEDIPKTEIDWLANASKALIGPNP